MNWTAPAGANGPPHDPRDPACPCDACFDALMRDAERHMLSLELYASLRGLTLTARPTLAGESPRRPTVSREAWQAYDRARWQLIIAQMRAIIEAEAIVAERGADDRPQ